MISFRQHLLTIMAIFLALAVGVVLGGGPLAGGEAGQADDNPARAQDDPTTSSAFDAGFAQAVGPALVGGKLADRSVVVVTLPGADEQVVSALSDAVTAAGGTVAARHNLAEAVVDPDQKSLVDTLGAQMLTQQGADAVEGEPSTYERLGQLLGLGIASTDPAGEGSTRKSRAILDALAGAELVPASDGEPARSPLVLLVLGAEAEDPSVDAIIADLATGLAAQSVGVVVAGSTADGQGQLGRLRSDAPATAIGTVDGVDTPAGVISTVLLLARALTAPGGSYGASGADGPVPLG